MRNTIRNRNINTASNADSGANTPTVRPDPQPRVFSIGRSTVRPLEAGEFAVGEDGVPRRLEELSDAESERAVSPRELEDQQHLTIAAEGEGSTASR